MIGIYKITNIANGKIYIGQSNNIERRFSEHSRVGSKSRIPVDLSIEKHGKENFNFEVIEECELCKLNERETHWIMFYDSIKNGYNCNPGGDNSQSGENNSNSKITEKDIVFIRQCYNNHKKQKEVYDNYFKDRITFGYFQNLWQGRSWSNVMPEVFTEENKQYYIYQNSKGENSINSIFSNEEVLLIRKRYVTETAKSIYKDYSERIKFQAFQAMLWGRSYKEVPVYSKKSKTWINN